MRFDRREDLNQQGRAMRFAAGLTVSGIIGFIVLEVLKLLLPSLAAGVLALLAFLVKIVLFGVGLVVVLAVVGLAVFFYKRSQRDRAEA